MGTSTADRKPNAPDLSREALQRKHGEAVSKARAAGLRITESRLNREGLPSGSAAPDFRLSDLHGSQYGLSDFRGKRVLLVFSDPACEPCQALAPSLQQIHQRHAADSLQVIVISRGDLEANRAKVLEHRLTFPVLLQRSWEVSKDYAMFATPVGYLINEYGVISKDVAIGADAILELV
jgi:peroxiredoxin